MENIIIRQVKPDDLAEIIAIENHNFKEEAASSKAMEERVNTTMDTFLVAEISGQVAGYIEGAVIDTDFLTDDLFSHVEKNPSEGGRIAITSLSIAEKYQDRGLGKILISAMKEVARLNKREAITLTCHDYLIDYYQKHDFILDGKSESALAGGVWYNMTWRV